MQIVHHANPTIGSFDWELPENIASRISTLPKETQSVIIAELEKHVKAHLCLLVGTLFMGSAAPVAFEMLDHMGAENARALRAFAMKL